ncbi:MAG TPA: methyltransferase domain-containing protein [Steroidobacteraceae bacterium]|jgi:2-polyprenyl-3-methyl-5-hydroxy-6-metoxy-1,4-benzoquinol methylase
MNAAPDAREQQIIRSWNVNAVPWAEAIRSGSIESRKLVTDRAIIDAVLGLGPRRILDLGCGEGWLARALAACAIQTVGIDVVPELIAAAARLGGGEFLVREYREIAQARWRAREFDAAVCNFSLLGKESVESLLAAIPEYLAAPGYLIVQTLHPLAACGDLPYEDAWRAGSWLGFGAQFSEPAPWYFRTLESWHCMLRRTGFEVLECREPTAPGARAPASVIFICKPRVREQTARTAPDSVPVSSGNSTQ